MEAKRMDIGMYLSKDEVTELLKERIGNESMAKLIKRLAFERIKSKRTKEVNKTTTPPTKELSEKDTAEKHVCNLLQTTKWLMAQYIKGNLE